MDDVIEAATRLECLKLACQQPTANGGTVLLGDATAVVTAARTYSDFVLGKTQPAGE